MRTVAILAGGGGFVTGLQCQAMNTGSITGGLPGMANGAIDRREGPVIVGMRRRDVGVATGATVGRVNRRRESGLVHEK